MTIFSEDPEINKLREEWPNLSKEEKMDKFLWKMVWFHHQKHVPGSPAKPIWDLTEVIKKATESSESLTRSIKNATWVAAIVGGLGVVVALLSLFKGWVL